MCAWLKRISHSPQFSNYIYDMFFCDQDSTPPPFTYINMEYMMYMLYIISSLATYVKTNIYIYSNE